MFTHDAIWRAIDRLAEEKGFSASGLARQAGLDPTSFNRSKRISPTGKPRWPSTESLAKILQVTGASFQDLLDTIEPRQDKAATPIPLLPYALLRRGNLQPDQPGQAFTLNLDTAHLKTGREAFAVTLEDEKLKPLYRKGAILVADRAAKIVENDRILFFSRKEGLKAGILHSLQKRSWSVLLPDQDFHEASFPENDIEWIARILWASQ